MSDPIIIVGAGIGGMTAALALLQRGIPVEIYEDAPELGDVGAGLTIGPSARKVLEHLKLIEPLRAEVVAANAAGHRHYQTGEFVQYSEFTDTDWLHGLHGTWFLHRADLHNELVHQVRLLAPQSIHLSHHLTSFEQDGSQVTAIFDNGVRVTGRGLIGSDGLRSTVRAGLFGQESPRFSGVVAWRGLIPVDRIPAGTLTPDSCRWIGPNWRILCYPVRHRTLINYVAAVGRQTWTVESWKEHSEVQELVDAFADGDPTISRVVAQTPPELCFKWALYDRDPLTTWTQGRVTLLGDAAHAMLPFLGMGAAMAMEDGLVMARCLAEYDDVETAFQRYQQARQPRANEVQIASREIGTWPFKHVPSEAAKVGASHRNWSPLTYDAGTTPI